MIKVYRGIDDTGKTVVFMDGDPLPLLKTAIESFSGDEVGDPRDGSCVTSIGNIEKIEVCHDEEPVEKLVCSELEEATGNRVDEELEKLNKRLAENGIRIIEGTAETRIVKAAEEEENTDGSQDEQEERTVLAVVLEPNDGEEGAPLDPDLQGDIYSIEAVRNTAWGWMEKGGKIGLMHQLDVTDKVSVIESYVALSDFEIETTGGGKYKIRKGVWLLRLRIYDDMIWKKAKDGTLGAFSVGGTAQTQSIENEPEKE